MIQPFSAVRNLVLAFFLISLSACGGGGGGGQAPGNVFGVNGGQVSGSASPANGGVSTYTFNATANTAYTVKTTTITGDAVLFLWNGTPTSGGANLIGFSWHSPTTTPLNTVSFVANFTGTVYVQVVNRSMGTTGSTYTLEAFTGNLAIGTARTGSTHSDPIYYSFDAVGGTAYQVQLTPQTGNVNIGSVNTTLSASVGSSLLTSTSMDTVTFQAPATQRYYVRVDPTSVATTFNVKVVTTTAQPDLRVMVSSAVSDSTNVTVNYTVYNDGLTAAGPFNVALWSDAASAPTIGTVGQASATIASLAAGASVTGSVVIPNAATAGTAYAIVDTANAIAETDETNNVSPGRAWVKPLPAPQAFNFENGLVPAAMTMSGNTPWSIDAATGSASLVSLKAGTITHSQFSCVALRVVNAASVSFDYAVSSEYGYDFLTFYIDGVVPNVISKSGTVPWTPSGAISVTSGTHELKWCYSKDWAFSSGSDTAWIDNIVVTSATPDLQVVVTSAVSDGANVTVNYTATNAGTSSAGPFRVDAWSSSATAPLVGANGEGSTTIASLAAGASVTGSLVIANAAASGTAYAIVDTPNAVIETNETNNVSSGAAWVAPPTAPQTFNFETGPVPTALAMTGNLPWGLAAGGPVGSTISLKAGGITHSQTSCIQVAVANSTTVSFDYAVSSELSWDFLQFYIDGVLKSSWSGVVPWASSGAIAAGAAGLHTYKWCYSKDSVISANADTAWIDNIVIN